MSLPMARISLPRAQRASGWQKGSPPEKVTPWSRGSSRISRRMASWSAHSPPSKSWVWGLWQPGQRWGQPWVKMT